ncbi:hypothetical protein LTR49_028519, partial [Elasticomyces elasticus]
MPLSARKCDLYLAWYRSTHIAHPTFTQPIDRALAQFRDAFHASESPISPPHIDWGRLMGLTVEHFTFANAMINRWPLVIHLQINHRHPTSSSMTTHEDGVLLSFHLWAQPRYLERREQVVAVWYTLLHFLIFHR